ncbi:MAG TPA: hypothetical protein VG845_15535 [Dehalococcoidia bacterium]|jgi:hypothetical protein|nr:hypothetical protein [Dehalococcoidia bacterium]
MPSVADIADPAFREALEDADRLLDDGDFAGASRRCAETYLVLLERHPELIPPHSGPTGFYQMKPPEAKGEGTLDQYNAARATRVGFWPTTGSIQVIVGEDQKPRLVYTKDRFSFSEASSYYEYLINQVWRLQKQDEA